MDVLYTCFDTFYMLMRWVAYPLFTVLGSIALLTIIKKNRLEIARLEAEQNRQLPRPGQHASQEAVHSEG